MFGKLEKFTTNLFSEYFTQYINHIKDISNKIDTIKLERIVNVFINAYNINKTIYFIGNGGSAATASHFAQDLAEVGRKCNIKVFKSMSLTDNVPLITAVGNDFGYEDIFVKQLECFFCKDDVLVSISASGNSKNIIKAIKYAKEHSGITVGLLGFDGGQAAEICDYPVVVTCDTGEYGPVEDIHMIFDHIITSFLYFKLKKS
jgi:D-sedoheptulose 7-phosphate isomerase